LNDPFLIDECLSLDLVALATARNHYATHVVFRGLQGAQDIDLTRVIREGNYILVSANGKDFLAIYAK
jgi:predicted nuclease of predicted toxin-antitoxin system